MAAWQRTGAKALLLMMVVASPGWAGPAARAERPTPTQQPAHELPPVLVPLPPEEPEPESPTRRDPTAPITVVDAREREGQAQVASELLSEAPGVLVQDRGGLLQTRSLSLRGAASSGVLVLLDGIPLGASGSNVDLSRIPLAIVERFEVLRGGGSLYATGGLGGVVNVVTRKPREGALVSGGLTVGSFETGLGHLSATGALLGGHALAIVHGARTEGAFPYLFDERPNLDENDPLVSRLRENNDVALGGAMLRYRRALGEGAVLDAMAEYALDERGLAGTSQNPTPEARERAQRLTATARGSGRFGEAELSARAWAKRDDTALRGGLFGEALDQQQSSVGAEVTGQWLWGGRHGLNAAAEVAHEGLAVGTVGAEGAAGAGRANPSWLRAGVALSDEILLFDGLGSVVPSMRVDQTGPFTTFSPKLGARYELPAGFQLGANAGQAHRAPSFTELYVTQGTLLPNPELRPERALFADLTVQHRTERTHVALTGFTALYEELIAYEYYPPFLSRPYNFAAARVEGAELEASARPSKHFDARASYTLTFSRNLRDEPRYYLKALPFRPRHRLVASASGGLERARLRAEVDLQSGQYMNRTNTLELPARALVNAGVTAVVSQAPRISLALDLKNAFDVAASDFDGYPLPGRSLFLTLSFSLDRSGDPSASPGAQHP